jgi:hypothetical protein
VVPGQLGQIVHETLSRKYPTPKKRAGRVAQVIECLPNKFEAFSSNPGSTKTTTTKNLTYKKRASRVAQVVERLPREKAVSSNPISTKKHF